MVQSLVNMMQELTTQKLKLRFYELDVTIHSDSSAYVNLFAQMYGRFRVDDATVRRPLSPSRMEFVILTQPDNPWGKPTLILDGRVLTLPTARVPVGYIYESILNTIVARIRSHFLIHAGVVAANEQGIILCGDSGHGKTTLTLELIRRGFTFLSDEMAAISRKDGRVHPFPRSLRLRPGTLELAGFPEAAVGAPQWLDKYLLDIEEIKPNSMGQATSIDHIIILRDPTRTDKNGSDPAERELGILVHRLDDELLTAVSDIEGVTKVETGIDRSYPLIKLHASNRTQAISRVEAICHQREILIVDVIKRAEEHATFADQARLETIPKSQAVMELLRRFQGGHHSALLQDEYSGNSARLFMELAGIIGQANCYQLFVGPLSQMADLVQKQTSSKV